MNTLNDEIGLIEWNKDDGPKFESVDQMKEFISKLENNEFDYLFNGSKETSVEETKSPIVESFELTLNNIFFYIYTFEKNDNFITYMSLKNLDENDTLHNLCGNKSSSKESAHSYFEELKNAITTNELDDILENLIVGAENTIKQLKQKLELLTSES